MSRALRRVVVMIGAAIGLTLGSAPAQALTADFPTACTQANFVAPARVSVIKQDTYFDSRSALHTDCTSPYLSEYFSARWNAVDENGAVVDEVWFHTFRDPAEWGADPAMSVNDRDHLGLWRWHPVSGFTDVALPYVDITLTVQEMNSPTTDVRVGSAGTVSAVRVGAKVTVSTRSSRYWTSTHAFGPWAKAVGIIQYRSPGTTTWQNLKNVAADGYGRYAYTYTVSSRRDYRFIAFDKAPYIYGSVSSNVSTA